MLNDILCHNLLYGGKKDVIKVNNTFFAPMMKVKVQLRKCCLWHCFPINAGRIHSATVKTVNITKATINVEWAEKGMTKGKEVGT